MISKHESIWSSLDVPPASLADLDRNLEDLSLHYMKQSIKLPLNHEKRTVLARLYSAANALHHATKEGAVEDAIFEIGSNLIGCEQVALLVVSKRQDRVDFIGCAGFDPKQLDTLRRNAKRIIEEAPEDSVYVEAAGKGQSFLSSLGISARIPFWLDSATKGAIVFFDLLPQRNGLNAGDRELLNLLCAYTGPCLAANKMKHQETLGWVQL